MSKFLKKYQDIVLIFLAFVFLVVVAAYFIWGVGSLIDSLNRAANPAGGASGGDSQFGVEAAKEILRKRGLVE